MERFGLYKPEQKFGVRCCHYRHRCCLLSLHFFANASSANTELTNIVDIATIASIATVDLVFMSILFYHDPCYGIFEFRTLLLYFYSMIL